MFTKCDSQQWNEQKFSSWEPWQSKPNKVIATDNTIKNNARTTWYSSKKVFETEKRLSKNKSLLKSIAFEMYNSYNLNFWEGTLGPVNILCMLIGSFRVYWHHFFAGFWNRVNTSPVFSDVVYLK